MTMIEGESEKEVKQGKNNHLGDEIEIDLMDILRKIIAIRKTIYKAVGIGLVIGIIIALSIQLLFLQKWEILKVEAYPV